jgi:hypothetical protein
MTAEHQLLREDVMADVDGQLAAPRRAVVTAHLQDCAECRALVADLRSLSSELAAHDDIEAAPSTLADRARIAARRRHLWLRARTPLLITAAAGIAFVSLVMTPPLLRSRMPAMRVQAPSAAATPSASPDFARSGGGGGGRGGSRSMLGQQGQQGQQGNAADLQFNLESERRFVARTASLSITTERFEGLRDTIETITRAHDGRIGHLEISGEPPAPRRLRATVRIPPARLDAALTALRQLGQVTHESAASDDVTDSVRDLRVRIANGRREEQRLVELLARRTGDLKDVLEVERALARVRTEVEQMEAQERGTIGRVDLAAVTLEVGERYRAELAPSSTPLGTRLRNALVDGARTAGASVLSFVTLFLQLAPTIAVWLVLLALPARAIWRRATAR